jgi:hypothetical protein
MEDNPSTTKFDEDSLEDIVFRLETYLTNNFDFVYNHNGFFIVGNNDTPINSPKGTTGESIWLKMVDYVKGLMIKDKNSYADKFYGKLGTNFVFAYGSNTELKEMSERIYDKFNRKMVPLYVDDKLHYTYLNDNIIIQKLDTLLWKPVNSDKKYNKIIESIMKMIFDTMSLVYKERWGLKEYDFLFIILQKDVENGYHIPSNFETDVAIKTYLYQVWILMVYDMDYVLSPEQKKIKTFLNEFKNKGIPAKIPIDLKSPYTVDKKIVYKEIVREKKAKTTLYDRLKIVGIVLIASLIFIMIIVFTIKSLQ